MGLQDHPSFPLALRLHEPTSDPLQRLAISALLRASHVVHHDLQLLAMDVVDPADPSLALLMGAVMQVHSRGTVRLQSTDPTVDPIVDFAMLTDERDLSALRVPRPRSTERVALQRADGGDRDRVPYDLSDEGLRAAWATTCTRSARAAWVPPTMTRPWSTRACRVIGYEGLLVCDASVMPAVPRANTHLPTVMIAERIAACRCDVGKS